MPPLPHDPLTLCAFAVWGLIGGLIGASTRTHRLELPRVVCEHSKTGQVKRYVDPGFLTAAVFGAVVAAAIDGRPWTALAYGIAVGYAGPAIVRALVDRVLRTLSLEPQEPPSAPVAPLTPMERTR
jgi:hypothetical protein